MDRKTKIKNRSAQLTRLGYALASPTLYFAAGALFAEGRIMAGAYPFAISFAMAATGAGGAVAATLGGTVGMLRVGGAGYAVMLFLSFVARLIIGRWLGSPEEAENVSVLPRSRVINSRAFVLLRETFDMSFKESVGIRMALSSVAAMVGGAVMCARYAYATEYIIGSVVAALSAPALSCLFVAGLSRDEETPEILREAGKLALAASGVLSLSGTFELFDGALVSAFAVTLLVTRSRGIPIGALYGVVCGVVLTPVLAPMYALSAIVSGALWRVSQTAAISSACAVSVVWSIYVTGLSAMNTVAPELIVTSAILVPLCVSGVIPTKPLASLSSAGSDEIASFVLRGDETARRMRTLSGSMRDISEVLRRLAERLTVPETDELCEICEVAFEESCSGCVMKNTCFGREAKQTSEMQARMTLQLKNDGRVSASAVSPHIARRCSSIGDIIDRMNRECSRRVAERRLHDRTSVVAADYEVMSDVLRESSELDAAEYGCDRHLTNALRHALRGTSFSAESVTVFGDRTKRVIARGVSMRKTAMGAEDLRVLFSRALGLELTTPEFELDGRLVTMTLSGKPKLSVRCGRASVAMSELKRRNRPDADDLSWDATRVFIPGTGRVGLGRTYSEQCGDVISAFATEDGRFFMLISDGMGSGKEAALTSGVCAVFLEKMLKAGASMDTSLKMLNSMMRARESECSATVDLMELDLMNGGVRFVKSGAAPSFVLRGGRLFRLQSKTVPIGIVRALDAEMIKFETERGDIVVMLSDGVARSFEDCPWLYDLLCDESEWVDDPERMARKIIKCAVKNGADDDITAGVVLVE